MRADADIRLWGSRGEGQPCRSLTKTLGTQPWMCRRRQRDAQTSPESPVVTGSFRYQPRRRRWEPSLV